MPNLLEIEKCSQKGRPIKENLNVHTAERA